MDIGVIGAFLGGMLALLSPCGAMLLPGYLAARAGSPLGLLPHGLLFLLGLVATLVPLGLGIGALGALFASSRGVVVALTSALLLILGVAYALGGSLDVARLVPGLSSLQRVAVRGAGPLRTLLLGATGGVAGFCAGPILGAVLTLAFGSGSPGVAAFLLAVYGAGMVVPLMLLAALWQRWGGRALPSALRGREVRVGSLRLHSTRLVAGALMVAMGMGFWVTDGLLSAPSLVPTSVLAQWQAATGPLDRPAVQIGLILLLGALALLWWWRRERNQA